MINCVDCNKDLSNRFMYYGGPRCPICHCSHSHKCINNKDYDKGKCIC